MPQISRLTIGTLDESIRKTSNNGDLSASLVSGNSNREYSNASEVTGENINPSNFTDGMHHAMIKEASGSLEQESVGNVNPSHSTSMNSSLSFSLDQGLNKMVSSSPEPTVSGIQQLERGHLLSSSQAELTVTGEERCEGFYKASVNMWKDVTSSDDETVLSQLSDGNRKVTKFERKASGLDDSIFLRTHYDSGMPSDSAKVLHNSEDPEVVDNDNKERMNEVNGGALVISLEKNIDESSDLMLNLCDNEEAIDCDIACRVEMLASRSSSFKQLHPSKKP